MRKVKEFIVYGEPQGKARPRFARTNKGVRTFTPQKTTEYEERVQLAYRQVYKDEPIQKPVKVYIQAHFSMPKSWSRKKKVESLLHRPTKKPDVDNIAKAICDALNGVAYKDDSQIVELNVSKYYAPCDIAGFVSVRIEEVVE